MHKKWKTYFDIGEKGAVVELTGADATCVLHAVYTALERMGYQFEINGPKLHETQGDNGGGLCPTNKIRLPWSADEGFDAIRRIQQSLGASRIRLSKRDGEIKSRNC
jgi:hypothetical protein